MKLARIAFVLAAVAALGGCAVYGPAPGYYYGGPAVVGVYHGGWHRW